MRERKYGECGRSGKGLIGRFLGKMSGLSVPQITRLIRQQLAQGTIAARSGQRRRFPTKYSAEDVTRLVEVDRAHQRLSGPATCCILRREFQTFGRKQFERLAGLSVSHLYNLRGSAGYRRQCADFDQTRPIMISIAERRRPDARGQPGY